MSRHMARYLRKRTNDLQEVSAEPCTLPGGEVRGVIQLGDKISKEKFISKE